MSKQIRSYFRTGMCATQTDPEGWGAGQQEGEVSSGQRLWEEVAFIETGLIRRSH